MPENTRSRIDLEEMARQAVREAPGCAHVIDVELQYIETNGRRPNWRLINTTPPLPPAALIEAGMAVDRLASRWLMIDG
ncbi:MAG: hypothetical protein JO055_03560 [Alphaproteobacteria bacterium]|nr:hypothetical protein [Alphaproteobacteria bacterium]